MRRTGWRIGFTLIELLVVIAIIAILAAILFPVFAQARDKARGSACLSNMKQIGTGVYMYLQDYDETYPLNRFDMVGVCCNCKPSGYTWKEAINPYVKNIGIWVCPSAKYAKIDPCCTGSLTIPTSYGTNGSLFDISGYHKSSSSDIVWGGGAGAILKRARKLADINRPAESLWVIEQDGKTWAPCPDNGDWTIPTGGGPDRHACGNTWIFCDGHAKWSKLVSTLAPWDAWNDKEGPNQYLKNLPAHNKYTGCQ
jgi:prepilin-type N-terminal cleavage/methylation domain-containing protein